MSVRRWVAPLLLCGALIGQALANEAPPDTAQPARMPRLALVIDDLGQNPARDRRVLALPGPVALAILPDTRHAAALAEQAHRAGKTVMLHMPMAPAGGRFAWHPQLAHDELERRLDAALAAVPHVSGVNNHMGSAMTEQPQAMAWLMGELQRRHLFFLDSRTSPRTVAAASAQRVALASLSRDVFLDNDPSPAAVAERLRTAIALARKQGSVVVIGHPHDSTLALLERELPRLAEQGIEWIGIDQMIATRGNRAMAAHGKGGMYR
ncbi:polysaccharide deacetylase [Pseudomonas sp. BAY1663]|uniref:divergent polysaccharide deacetylase family protein n=1 Tax=Pseudomonas sp. BAY1663 TaxID=1439940 RepID=UPI00042DEEA8|nr:divergent polysaccharide deacetylase family protein [Pseudomonas sp. BAY1663]EXF43793.1 polysaccharide deacetylase [Pseudomonas sp. BAY1663]